MNEFTASNGISVERVSTGGLHLDYNSTVDTNVFIPAQAARAVAEFFRAEEDERLERWRFPELPSLLVYHWGQPTAAGVVVLDEGSGAASRVIHRNADPDNESPDYRAARAYFDAHPEPKPWHEAKPGEVWIIDHDGDGEFPYLVTDKFGKPTFTYLGGLTNFSRDDRRITAGRRIYPEVTE